MRQPRRSSLVVGILLILLGSSILVLQLVPGIRVPVSWPWIIIGLGLLLLILGGVTGVPALAVPAAVIAGIGAILTYQDLSGDWDSWAYVWTLMPGFVGLGLLVASLLTRDGEGSLRAGGVLMIISLALFAGFGSLFGALGWVSAYWPVLLIVLGLALLLGPLLRRR